MIQHKPKQEKTPSYQEDPLPKFETEKNGDMIHHTQTGRHGKGMYHIRLDPNGIYQLSFVNKNGHQWHLGGDEDLTKVKHTVAGFKKESEVVTEDQYLARNGAGLKVDTSKKESTGSVKSHMVGVHQC